MIWPHELFTDNKWFDSTRELFTYNKWFDPTWELFTDNKWSDLTRELFKNSKWFNTTWCWYLWDLATLVGDYRISASRDEISFRPTGTSFTLRLPGESYFIPTRRDSFSPGIYKDVSQGVMLSVNQYGIPNSFLKLIKS